NEEYLPVYGRRAVGEGKLWANITSIDFWATEGGDGIGYSVSKLAPGGVSKALGEGKAISKLPMLKGRIGGQAADVTSATIANTILEAGAEAHHSMEALQKNLDDRFQKGEIDINEYSELLSQKSKLGRDVFLANTVILLGP